MIWQHAAYAENVNLPVFFCSGCGRPVQLPYRHFLNSSIVEPYWPDGDPALPWVCDACGRYKSCTAHDVRWVAETEVPPLSPSRGFWRVQVPCLVPGCGSSVVAHVQTFGQTSRKNLGLMLARASPTLICEAGHAISAGKSYPEQIDFVEWNGPDQYIT